MQALSQALTDFANDAPYGLLENVAALSGAMHTHPRYQEFYETFQDRLSGFTGIYRIVIDLAGEFHKLEIASPDIWDRIDWVSTVDKAVDYLIDEALRETWIPSAENVMRITLADQGETWEDDN